MINFLRIYILYYIEVLFHVRMKPRQLQLPITSKCNSKCLTCNVWKYHNRKDIDVQVLGDVLNDPFFSKVSVVGINGGEPVLHDSFVQVINTVLSLPKLKTIYIISNCINNDKLLINLKEAYPLCKKRHVHLHLQISVDGIGDVHNKIRGINVSFERSMKLFLELYNNPGVYLDSYDIGCTISKYNVDYLPQIEDFFSDYNIPIYFHLAVPNKRIHNFEDYSFSVLKDEHALHMAKEFFLMRTHTGDTLLGKIRSYLIYYYLSGHNDNRLFICNYLYQDITINEIFDVYLCATASERVGNLKEGFPLNKYFEMQVEQTRIHCNNCIHYANIPNLRGLFLYLRYRLKTAKWYLRYK